MAKLKAPAGGLYLRVTACHGAEPTEVDNPRGGTLLECPVCPNFGAVIEYRLIERSAAHFETAMVFDADTKPAGVLADYNAHSVAQAAKSIKESVKEANSLHPSIKLAVYQALRPISTSGRGLRCLTKRSA